MVFKPVDGVGCSGLSVVKQETQIHQAIAKIKRQSKSKRFVVQEFLTGESASVSLLATSKKAQALSLNKQTVNLAEPPETSSYDGGCVPFEHPLSRKFLLWQKKWLSCFRVCEGMLVLIWFWLARRLLWWMLILG